MFNYLFIEKYLQAYEILKCRYSKFNYFISKLLKVETQVDFYF